MKTISSSLIKRLKKSVLITELCTLYNIELQSEGKSLYGYCPFHEDGALSFIVIPSKNIWKCACGCHGESRGGDNIHFVMKLEKISVRRAVEKLIKLQSILQHQKQISYRLMFKSHHD